MPAFSPIPAGTVTLAATAVTSRTAIAKGNNQLEITNAGPDTVFVEVGDSTVAAVVATGYPILLGATRLISVNPLATHIAAISAGTSTVYASAGTGE
jgi:hypothetical protein